MMGFESAVTKTRGKIGLIRKGDPGCAVFVKVTEAHKSKSGAPIVFYTITILASFLKI